MVYENNGHPKKGKWVWRCLAIFFFPISLSVLFYKTDKLKLKKNWKVLIIATAWIVMFVCVRNSNGTTQAELSNAVNEAPAEKNHAEPANSNPDQSPDQGENTSENSKTSDSDEFYVIDTFIEKYNATTAVPMTDPAIIDINDKSSEHYRTEYRTLNNALAKQCRLGDATIDIISTTDFLSEPNIRIYLNTESIEFATEVFDVIAKLVYPNISDSELTEAHNNLNQESSSTLNDIVFYYIQSYNELFMNNVMYAE